MMVSRPIGSSRRSVTEIHESSFMDNLKFYTLAINVSACILSKANVNSFYFYEPVGGAQVLCTAVSVVVMDGITIGHPRCALDGCKLPLATARDRYCSEHRCYGNICVIQDCGQNVVANKLTCQNPLHQAVEHLREMRGQSRFQLQERLQRARVAHPNDAIAEERGLDEIADEEDVEQVFLVDGKETLKTGSSEPETTNFPQLQVKKRLRAQFGRKRTHNEQVIVAPCGMILARETFYGAEAISSCVVCGILLILYSLSQYVFYRNLSKERSA
jgi:hypothetical protein